MPWTPGRSRDPDTIAAMVSMRCALVFSATAAGSGRSSAPATWALTSAISGLIALCLGFIGRLDPS